MEFNMLKSAIPPSYRRLMRKDCEDVGVYLDRYVGILAIDKEAKLVYEELCQCDDLLLSKIMKWECDFKNQIVYEDFIQEIKSVFQLTKVSKYRSFQYRMLHRAIITNVQLHKWGIIENNLCTLCTKSSERVVHLFGECQEVQSMVKQFT